MKLSEMRQVLDEEGIRLTKSLGQNFLHDNNQLRRIVAAAELSIEDNVLEIGPGLGPLTAVLVEKANRVLAIETDARLVTILRRRFADAKNLELIHDDALEYLKRDRTDWSHWKLIANLPYSVGSPILVELAQAAQPPKSMTATLQLEVVQRLISKAGTADYGILTLLIQARYEPVGHFKIAAGSFFPEPDIDSACITLHRRENDLIAHELSDTFTAVVKRAFSQRRKMMFKLLREDWPAEQLQDAFRVAKIREDTRAEQVSLEQFASLGTSLGQSK